MAGAKETPRQKMIGMMYLVLTALLALNVSKQIVQAFVTINDKLEKSNASIDDQILRVQSIFDQKRVTVKSQGLTNVELDFWSEKLAKLDLISSEVNNFILNECNEMIKESEGISWIESNTNAERTIKLKPLHELQNMDDYDVPTRMFVGDNPNSPNERGKNLVATIHNFRNSICELIGNYQIGIDKSSFVAPLDESGLEAALASVKTEDKTFVEYLYKSLTIPDKIYSTGEEKEMPWVSVVFDHAPVVAAAAMFTSIQTDIKNAQLYAAQFMLDKVDVPTFKFNKIQPIPFVSSSYYNQGDSFDLNVLIAAYDTNEINKVRYAIDGDTISKDIWKESIGGINLLASKPGMHKIKGEVAVLERGQEIWKPWELEYRVGAPMGVVAQPDMRVFYWGYENVIEGTASGYANEKVKLVGSGCRLESKGNGKYIVHVDRGTRSASISVIGTNDDGSSTNLGVYNYVCKPLPKATIYFGRAMDGDKITLTEAQNVKNVRIGLGDDSFLTNVNYTILGGNLYVGGISGEGSIGPGGKLDDKSISLVRQGKGRSVSLTINYSDQSGIKRIGSMTCYIK